MVFVDFMFFRVKDSRAVEIFLKVFGRKCFGLVFRIGLLLFWKFLWFWVWVKIKI